MRRIIILFSIFSFAIFVACAPTNKVLTTNVQDITSFEPNSYIYSLPKTKLIISVTALRHTTIPGPFHNYAERFLGIKGAPSISYNQWELNKVDISSVQEADPDHYYSVANDDYASVREFLNEFGAAGLVISPGQYKPIEMPGNLEKVELPIVAYTDLSVKRNFEKTASNTFDNQERESAFAKLPYSKKDLEAKSIPKKAEEAANFIIKIRKRRFKLIAGQYEVFPEGVALETAIKQLNKTEEEYLSLFIGKTYTDTIKKVIVYEPEARQELQRNTIFRFSDDSGIITTRNAIGKAVILEIADLGKTRLLEHMMIPGSSPTKENMLFYRIPDNAEVKILYGSHEIVKAQMPISQFGAIVPFYVPEKILK